MSKLNKGDCILVGNEWYVVLKDKDKFIVCLCDHANNIHYWNHNDIRLHVSAKAILQAYNFHYGDNEVLDALTKRTCPVNEIAEVLAGVHDDRVS